MKRFRLFTGFLGVAMLAAPVVAKESAKPARQPVVQVAILLDNSGSMSGLIEQAKSELWKVVNEFIVARQKGQRPRLEVALYTYGDPPPKQLSAFSDNLDKVSELLFAVAISGGSEHCGEVIQQVVSDLAWSSSGDDLKLIFIAGNEPFNQGSVDYRQACRAAIARGIQVNTIHCGEGIPADWRDGAVLADGRATSIDQDRQVVHVDAPQDKEIVRLGELLNTTYVAFGAAGTAGLSRQVTQDSNALSQSTGSATARALCKANFLYNNADWDLVDAVKEGKVDLVKVKKEELPKEMQAMTLEQQRAHLAGCQTKRAELQEKINGLEKERRVFVDAKRKELAATDKATLDVALIGAIRDQASKKNFTFE